MRGSLTSALKYRRSVDSRVYYLLDQELESSSEKLFLIVTPGSR